MRLPAHHEALVVNVTPSIRSDAERVAYLTAAGMDPAIARELVASRPALHAPIPITPPRASSAPAAQRSPMPPARDPAADARRLAKIVARLEHLEREVRPRVATFEQTMADLERQAREKGDDESVRRLADVRRAHEREHGAPPAARTLQGVPSVDQVMGLVRVNPHGVVRTPNGIALGVPVAESAPMPNFRPSGWEDTRTDEERERAQEALRRATQPTGPISTPQHTTTVARTGDTRTDAQRQHDAAAMRIAMGGPSIRHDGVRVLPNGSVQLGVSVPVDPRNPNRNR